MCTVHYCLVTLTCTTSILDDCASIEHTSNNSLLQCTHILCNCTSSRENTTNTINFLQLTVETNVLLIMTSIRTCTNESVEVQTRQLINCLVVTPTCSKDVTQEVIVNTLTQCILKNGLTKLEEIKVMIHLSILNLLCSKVNVCLESLSIEVSVPHTSRVRTSLRSLTCLSLHRIVECLTVVTTCTPLVCIVITCTSETTYEVSETIYIVYCLKIELPIVISILVNTCISGS